MLCKSTQNGCFKFCLFTMFLFFEMADLVDCHRIFLFLNIQFLLMELFIGLEIFIVLNTEEGSSPFRISVVLVPGRDLVTKSASVMEK